MRSTSSAQPAEVSLEFRWCPPTPDPDRPCGSDAPLRHPTPWRRCLPAFGWISEPPPGLDSRRNGRLRWAERLPTFTEHHPTASCLLLEDADISPVLKADQGALAGRRAREKSPESPIRLGGGQVCVIDRTRLRPRDVRWRIVGEGDKCRHEGRLVSGGSRKILWGCGGTGGGRCLRRRRVDDVVGDVDGVVVRDRGVVVVTACCFGAEVGDAPHPAITMATRTTPTADRLAGFIVGDRRLDGLVGRIPDQPHRQASHASTTNP